MGQIHEKYIAFDRKYIPSHKNYNYYDTEQDRRQVLRAKTGRVARSHQRIEIRGSSSSLLLGLRRFRSAKKAQTIMVQRVNLDL